MWQTKWAKELREEDFPTTPARFVLLRTLYVYRYGLTRQKLSRLLGVAGPGVTRMVKVLEREEFVTAERDERDRRCARIRLTDLGVALVREMLGKVDEELVHDLDRTTEAEARRWFASAGQEAADLEVLDAFLIRARARQDDPAIYPYPWHGGEVLRAEPGTIAEPHGSGGAAEGDLALAERQGEVDERATALLAGVDASAVRAEGLAREREVEPRHR
jgi:DNA-binding MarR family transcriptional regulator